MPGPDHTKRAFADDWVQSARRDLDAARLLLEASGYDGYEMIGFHAQQTLEKLIKAMLVLHQIPFERDHNISLLRANLRTVDATLADALAFADWLTPFAARYRYPGRTARVDRARAESAVADAERVQAQIAEQMEPFS